MLAQMLTAQGSEARIPLGFCLDIHHLGATK
jgi:hypothetical protein